MAQLLKLSPAEAEAVETLLSLPPEEFRESLQILRQVRDGFLPSVDVPPLGRVALRLCSPDTIARVVQAAENALKSRLDQIQHSLEPQLRALAAARGLNWDMLDEDTKDSLIAEIIRPHEST